MTVIGLGQGLTWILRRDNTWERRWQALIPVRHLLMSLQWMCDMLYIFLLWDDGIHPQLGASSWWVSAEFLPRSCAQMKHPVSLMVLIWSQRHFPDGDCRSREKWDGEGDRSSQAAVGFAEACVVTESELNPSTCTIWLPSLPDRCGPEDLSQLYSSRTLHLRVCFPGNPA